MCVILASMTLAAFWPVLTGHFINFDDDEYVFNNSHVTTGLTPANVRWAFTTGHAANWHPLTWISHMLDVQLFGVNAPRHHAVNLVLHIADSILLLLVLVSLTAAPWRSFFVAALFAFHPLHVESVAWISERKDVLSTLFFLLTIQAYARYARGSTNQLAGARFWYLTALGFFVLGLMSKPMLVTLPFVLLLLDYWPLSRFRAAESISPLKQAFRLLTEKLPFLVLALVSCVLTLLVQDKGRAVKSFFPLSLRLANAIVSYCSYLGKTLWPSRLAIFYPHPNTRFLYPQKDPLHPPSEQWPAWAIVIAAALLVAASAWVIKHRRRWPWLLTGWFWYLGTLVPVIGLIQVGIQGMADRYTYIPLIGIFISVAWSLAAVMEQAQLRARFLKGLAGAALLACAFITHRQAGYWHDNLTLFTHALNVTSNNAMAEWQVGAERAKKGDLDAAEAHFRAALLDDPWCFQAHFCLASLLETRGHSEAAVAEYELTLKLTPWDDAAGVQLAALLRKLGRISDSIAQYQEVLEFNPQNLQANYELGAFFLDRGDLIRAGTFLDKTLQLKPNHADALLCESDLKARLGDLPAAESDLRKLVALFPTNSDLRINLGGVLWQQGKHADAVAEYTQAVRLRPESAMGHYNLGIAYAAQRKLPEATREFEEAVRLGPDYPEALTELAWLLATNPKSDQRDGNRALRLAQRGLDLGSQKSLRAWAALDVAYAETSQFSQAIAAAEKARDLAIATGQTNAASLIEGRLALYRRQQPFHSE
jgi:tetratricopeptide (TPR) repeat protein